MPRPTRTASTHNQDSGLTDAQRELLDSWMDQTPAPKAMGTANKDVPAQDVADNAFFRDRDRQARILEAAGCGATYRVCAEVAGITYRTLRRWLTRGEQECEAQESGSSEDVGEYGRFYRAFKVMEAQLGMELLGLIRKAAKDPRNWAAAMTFLQRRYPEEWGIRDGAATTLAPGQKTSIQIFIQERDDWRSVSSDPYGKLADTGEVIDSTFVHYDAAAHFADGGAHGSQLPQAPPRPGPSPERSAPD